jgi:hypothetical protein
MTEQQQEAIAAYRDAMRQHDVPAGELEVYDSNSWRRVGMKGQFQTVMQPYVAKDGHPDIVGTNVLRALVAAFNAMPSALAEIETLEKSESEINDLYIEKRQLSIALAATVTEQAAEITRLNALINTPHTHEFIEAVRLEMPHQRERWGAEHDAGKTPADWLFLVGFLACKALHALTSGNVEKAKHHVITTAAALGNWYLAITGENTQMRPGIDTPKGEQHGE